MRRLLFIPALLGLCVLATSVFANPYASQVTLSSNTFVYGTTTSIDVSFRLNEAADQVTVQIIGPAPSTEVVRSIVATDLPRGVNVIAWDGLSDLAGPVPNGDYSAAVKAENLTGYAAWTNITPIVFGLTPQWTIPSTVWGIPQAANTLRGVGFNGTNVIVSGTATASKLSVLDGTGAYLNSLSLLVDEAWDINNSGTVTTGTFTFGTYLGPYDLASVGTKVYIDGYFSAPLPLTKPIALIGSTAADARSTAVGFISGPSRAMDVVNGGLGTIVYLVNAAANGAANTTTIFTTDNATTTALIEVVPSTFVNSHMICGKDGNTGGDGDVVWASSNSAAGGLYTRKYNRAAGAWTEDATFAAGLVKWCVAADYFVSGGREFLALNTVNGASKNELQIVDANTGELVASFTTPGTAGPFSDGNGDVVVNGSTIYFGASQQAELTKLTFYYGEINSCQYYTPNGLAIISDPTSPDFGTIAVSSGFPGSSVNPGAVPVQQGLYLLEPDMSWVGGGEATGFAAAMNDPAAPWDPADTMSPLGVGTGRDDSIFYQGDSGTNDVTDSVYRFDAYTTTTELLPNGAGNNNSRVPRAMTTGTGAGTVLWGLDRTGSHPSVTRWDIGETIENYTAAGQVVLPGGVASGLGFTSYSYSDFDIDTTGTVYVVCARWGKPDRWVIAFDPTLPLTAANLKWSQTGTSLGLVDGAYPRACQVDSSTGILYVYYMGIGTVGLHDIKTGALLSTFAVGGTGTRGGVTVDAAGNVYTCNNNDEHVRMWAPPSSAASYTTVGLGAVSMSASPAVLNVPDWMVY